MPEMSKEPRILSVQSHVVYGYVGNKCTFPLQVHGFDVDCVNTVYFSNHILYTTTKGKTFKGDDLNEIFEAIKINKLDSMYTHLITGFCPESGLKTIKAILSHLKTRNEGFFYVCDPAFADGGKLYSCFTEKIIEIYRDELVKLADMITPNQTELEMLTGVKIYNRADLYRAIKTIHDLGANIICVSSCELDNDRANLVSVVSCRSTKRCFSLKVPKIKEMIVGTGDLFTALLTTWMIKLDCDIKTSFEKSMATIQAVIRRTVEHADNFKTTDKDEKLASIELRVIQSRADIESPMVTCSALEENLYY